ncbi:lysM and putative peptidoglycan-binding domain-containing protein 3 [Euwallacea fornicatus]|uniref:lysM and putative peptidoglycan-binding domain-containing protein 3 n=1 Tax=Euwallacea fornicatus TaxID=995702 RepID=UPI00338FF0E6
MMKQRQRYYKYYKKMDKGSKDSGGSSDEETELFVKYKSPRHEIPTVEKEIEDGDTLQSLAIHYHCTIEELKRLNNIHKENEIFARRKIKVPHRPFSEALAVVHKSGTTSPNNNQSKEPSTSKLIDIDSLESRLGNFQEISEVNKIIFNSSIMNKEPENNTIYEPEENVNLLPQSRNVQPDPIISKLSCNGSDWDISYPALIACIVLVIVALPLIYVCYIAEHPEIYLNHTHSNLS